MKKYVLLSLLIGLFIACDEGVMDEEVWKSGEDGMYASTLGMREGGSAGGVGTGNGDTTQNEIVAGQITAGEWSDLENWDFWLNLGQQDTTQIQSDWDYNLNGRISVKLKDHDGYGINDLPISLLDKNNKTVLRVRTDHIGTAEFFPALAGSFASIENYKIKVGEYTFANLKEYKDGINELSIERPETGYFENKIDIAFVVDATGSMGDELEYLKVELVDVIDSVKETSGNAILNIGSVFYRDEGDDYVTKVSPFSTDASKTVSFIKDQSAAGGGDFPEAVHSALDKAINNLQWSSLATSRVIFLLLDAPPHEDAQIIAQIHSLVLKAAEKGIKIVPITASGIDKSTEFLMRYFAIATNGTYVFITGHSGIGGEHIEPTIGEYQVEFLNHLMVRLINEYLTKE